MKIFRVIATRLLRVKEACLSLQLSIVKLLELLLNVGVSRLWSVDRIFVKLRLLLLVSLIQSWKAIDHYLAAAVVVAVGVPWDLCGVVRLQEDRLELDVAGQKMLILYTENS